MTRQLNLDKALGIKTYDALHLACAESANVTAFLTTDDALLRIATRHCAQIHISVHNPLDWLKEFKI